MYSLGGWRPVDGTVAEGEVARMAEFAPLPRSPRITCVLVAAGSGQRFGADLAKQFLPCAGRPVMRHAADALAREGVAIQPVGEAGPIAAALAGLAHLPPVPGGATRQESVRAGLEALAADPPDIVLVHDAARPFIPAGTIAALIAALGDRGGAIPAAPVADTLKRGRDGAIVATVDRTGLFRAQTPQAFRFALLRDLHRAAGPGATDDAAVLEAAGHAVALVAGHEDNIKITWPEDLARMERILTPALLPRVGTGFDVHVLAEGRRLVLCGVEVAHERGLAGHSDADVGIHALCDAIYGALAEGDIGRHFPPSDMTYKDMDSAIFLRHAAARVRARGGVIGNVDVTLICERPKIAPHAGAMMARLAGLLGVDVGRVSVKATTTERLGFTGRMEGIAAQAVATVLVPG
jgi:2-C-methyl-D-erythritol 4-phosphate cytidylyltransferase/2-C-methyl-D-erythritol 2,4-cyclodiphosphate synthase